jgi:hypothetical protein
VEGDVMQQHVQATATYAREIAQMKARLVEKDAELLGGFGNPAKLADSQWGSEPPMTPLKLNPLPNTAFLERHFGFDSFINVPADKPIPSDRYGTAQAFVSSVCNLHVALSMLW